MSRLGQSLLELALGAQWVPTRVEVLESQLIRIRVRLTTTSQEIECMCDEHGLTNGQKRLAIALWSSEFLDREFVNDGDVVLIRNAGSNEPFRNLDLE